MIVWVLTYYVKGSIQMFEFENRDEAKAKYDKLEGCRILSEVIYYNDLEKVLVLS